MQGMLGAGPTLESHSPVDAEAGEAPENGMSAIELGVRG